MIPARWRVRRAADRGEKAGAAVVWAERARALAGTREASGRRRGRSRRGCGRRAGRRRRRRPGVASTATRCEGGGGGDRGLGDRWEG